MRFKNIKSYLKDNYAEEYIPALLSITMILIVSAIVISVASSINTRIRLDEKLDDISRLVEQTGYLDSDAIIELENQIKNQFGGEVTFYGEMVYDSQKGGHFVQHNKIVAISYTNDDYSAVSLGSFQIKTDISLSKTAVGTNYIRGLDESAKVSSYSRS